MNRRHLLPAIAIGLLIAVVTFERFPASGEPAPGPRSSGRAIHPWSMLGCWDLRVDPWVVRSAAAEFPRFSGEADAEAAAGAEDGAVGRPTAATPLALEPPSRLLLLPDSLDQWGRELGSYRAVDPDAANAGGATGADATATGLRDLRWSVRTDTLWIMWTTSRGRGGIALFQSGDSLWGRARASIPGDSLDAYAAAAAWKINCATYMRDRRPAERR